MSSVPFRVKAVYEYASEVDDDLNFPNGQIITVTDQEDDEWYTGEYVDASGSKRAGMFPRNFVEKYEPLTPPRPTRPNRAKKEPEPSVPVEAVKSPAAEAPSDIAPHEVEEIKPTRAQAEPPADPQPIQRKDSMPAPQPAPAQPTSQQPVSRSASGAAKSPPPPVAEKPVGGSFRDRIAAFNKPAAPAPMPFKPSGGGAGFIKKPFVAPPPSKDAFVPQPREPASQKVYRREEDPEITESGSRDIQPTPMAAAQAPAAMETAGEDPEEDQPKPTTLKERIALLQRQQQEQAARHAEAAQKKEKPKRPPKKRTESHEQPDMPEGHERVTELEKLDSHETVGKDEDTQEDKVPLPIPTPRTRPSGDSYISSPPPPPRDLVSDTNDADYSGAGDTEEADETSTSKDDSDERPRPQAHAPKTSARDDPPDQADEGSNEEDEEESEEEIDPEVKRKMELRERMAKMSGGYGMMGMFGPAGGLPGPSATRKPKSSGDSERKASADYERPAVAQAPPVPIMPLPGMGRMKMPEREPEVEKESEDEDDLPITSKYDPDELPDVEQVDTQKTERPRQSLERGAPPHVPGNRSAPAPPPTQSRPPPPPAPREHPLPTPPLPESRAVPPPPPRGIRSPTPGEESDDEMSLGASRLSLNAPDQKEAPSENNKAGTPLPMSPIAPQVPSRPEGPRSSVPRPDPIATASSPIATGDRSKRTSRAPPIPLASPVVGSPTQSRPPPPPPPSGEPPSRRSTMESKPAPPVPKHQAGTVDSDEETTEYDGDYDTDIASSAKHKDALKSHGRDSSLDEGTITDEPSSQSGTSPPSARPPPLPPTSAPRGVPPPPPPAQPPKSRKSTDITRAPPPIPLARDHSYHEDDDDYDPYNHTKGHGQILQSPTEEPEEDDLYSASPPVHSAPPPPPPSDRTLPPPPPPSQPMPMPPPTRGPARQSSDAAPQINSRRSMDAPRPTGEHGYIAADVDLAQPSIWWASANTPPPVFQNRRDIFFEIEETSTSQRGGKKVISKDVYILFIDYSQTVITVRYDALIPKDVSTLEQRHEPPPTKLRQDQLESAHARYGARISDAVSTKQNTAVGDGSPQGLILESLKPFTDALLPIGTRAYGALVYANLANATTQQHDEIRPGDIVSFRNAKFQGHRGSLHQKYSAEVGKPDHVAIVVDWDGTKKKVRAWEQGRESRKVKMESFKLGELRSGEVRVWRVMGRNWVGWESDK